MESKDLIKAQQHAQAHVSVGPGWELTQADGAGPFVSRLIHRLPDGSRHVWSSRPHRKNGGLRRHRLWMPSELGWWIAILFMIGSACFALGSLAGFVPWMFRETLQQLAVLNAVFFTGSLFFTSAAYLQLLEAANADRRAAQARGVVPAKSFSWFGWNPGQIGWLSAAVQFIGTLMFNLNTGDAMLPDLDWLQEDLLIWTPDVIGCICFLAASWLAVLECFHGISFWKHKGLSGVVVNINMLGSVAFGLSAVFAFVQPGVADVLDLQQANLWTFIGALCFFTGAGLLLPEMLQYKQSSETTG